jgi:peptidoglycan hydrolase-like protein with peptidoglycan-binding domain
VTLVAALALACAGRKSAEPVKAGPPGRESTKPESPDSPEEMGVPPKGERPRVPASPEALLAPGAVTDIQRVLSELGYLRAHRPGEMDRATSAAVRRFQEEEGLAATGMPDRETLRRLGIDPEAAYGRDR